MAPGLLMYARAGGFVALLTNFLTMALAFSCFPMALANPVVEYIFHNKARLKITQASSENHFMYQDPNGNPRLLPLSGEIIKMKPIGEAIAVSLKTADGMLLHFIITQNGHLAPLSKSHLLPINYTPLNWTWEFRRITSNNGETFSVYAPSWLGNSFNKVLIIRETDGKSTFAEANFFKGHTLADMRIEAGIYYDYVALITREGKLFPGTTNIAEKDFSGEEARVSQANNNMFSETDAAMFRFQLDVCRMLVGRAGVSP